LTETKNCNQISQERYIGRDRSSAVTA